MIEFYKQRHSTVQLSPLFKENDTPLASFYIRPEIYEKMQQIRSLSDTFKSESNDSREIYLTADAGLGKTTFSKYLATSWCQAHCPEEKDSTSFEADDVECMRKFEFVFLVLLRDSTHLCSVDDLIHELILSNLAHSEMFDKMFLQEILNHEKCLVILDGLDEWTHPENPGKPSCSKRPLSIPHRNDHKMCTVLTTTRPWKLGVLNLRSNESGKKVTLTKLSNRSAVTLTRRTLQRLKSLPDESLKDEVKAFIGEINARNHAELVFVPLLLMYIICLWCDGVEIGNSKCELYVNIVELLLSRTADIHGEFRSACEPFSGFIPECFTDHDHCTKYFTLLMNLGKLAYHTLFNEKRENTLVFDRKVAETYLKRDDMKFCLHSGILTESTTKKLTKQISKDSFSHKTVQEFFAALYISSQSDAQKIVVEKCKNVQSILDISMICEFLSKMNSKMMCEISAGLMSVINEDEETCNYRTKAIMDVDIYREPLYNIQEMFLSCLQQMTGSENIKLCLQDFFIDEGTIDDKHLQRLSKLNNTQIKSLFINIRNTSSRLRYIIESFCLTDLNNLHKLFYDDDIFNMKNADFSLLLFPSLKTVTLSFATWTNDEGKFCKRLESLRNVQYLDIRYLKLSHEMLKIFYNFISGNKSIEQLTLASLSCKEHFHGCRTILNLSENSQLKYVYLTAINHLDESSLLHDDMTRGMPNIERVMLVNIEISGGCLQNMVKNMEAISHLVTVKMSLIKPETEYERVKKYIRSSQTFVVTKDDSWFVFQTRKPRKE